jgi:hypothetical protein
MNKNKNLSPACPICGKLHLHCKCYDPKESEIKHSRIFVGKLKQEKEKETNEK